MLRVSQMLIIIYWLLTVRMLLLNSGKLLVWLASWFSLKGVVETSETFGRQNISR